AVRLDAGQLRGRSCAHPRREESEAGCAGDRGTLDRRRSLERGGDDARIRARSSWPDPARRAAPARARIRAALDRHRPLCRRTVVGQGRKAQHEARIGACAVTVVAVETTQWIIALGSIGSALIALALALGLKDWFFRPRVRLVLRHTNDPDEISDRI